MTIYFLQEAGKADGPIKIGFTAGDVGQRVGMLQTGYPGKLCLLAQKDGGEREEITEHNRWQHLHIHGEWFRADGDLLGYIRGFKCEPIVFGKPKHETPEQRYARKRFELWTQIVAQEPDLGVLLARARAMHDDNGKSFCATHRWYGCGGRLADGSRGCGTCNGGLKERVCELVGWDARRSSLRTTEAYDAAYELIYEALPDCRNCGCF